jgi:microcystin-dependent protein
MAQPYVGEIRMFAGNFAPAGWMFCEGQLLPISENETLFQLIGTTYGGDGESTFALPDLRGRIPIHQGNGFILAETGGAEEITLTINQIPSHSHAALCSTDPANTVVPQNAVPATIPDVNSLCYGTDNPGTTLSPNTIGPVGGSQPHNNFQPYLCVDFIISLFGLFPSPT